MLQFKILKIPIIIYLLSNLYSCSSTTSVKFSSTPNEADVSVVNSNGIATTLGKTPLTANESDVYQGNNRYTQVKIKKDGFLEQDIVLMKSTFGSDTSISVQLKKDETVQNIGEQSITQEKVASSIARTSGLILAKQYAEAENVMLSFVEQYPSVSVGYDYLGNINYLQKKYAKALKYYNRALALNPQNTERKIIIDRIQNLVKSQSGETQ